VRPVHRFGACVVHAQAELVGKLSNSSARATAGTLVVNCRVDPWRSVLSDQFGAVFVDDDRMRKRWPL
jgi:hypothetical protein